jgi:ribonuclease P protein component
MLKKENRLSKIKRSGGKRYSLPLFNIYIFQNKEEKARFGFVVSKKIDKRAVIRNKTKRVLRAAAKGFLKRLTGKDIIVISKKSLTFKEREIVEKEFEEIFNK